MLEDTASLSTLPTLPKSLTGIDGLDEITEGGLPKGRPTLVCGSAGCGKTLMAIEFLVRGILDYNEPGVLMTFEETAAELSANVASLGFDLPQMQADKLLRLDHVHVDRSEIEETGEYDLEGLFIRLGYAIDSIGAKRVVLDTVEALFSGFPNEAVLRSEIRRLFRWLKDKGVTTIITAERGEGTLTRQGLEEYVSDCVILLDNRVIDQITTRRLRIVKYRGSTHGTNEYPYLITEEGFSVLPITSLNLQHEVSNDIVSSGVVALDEMFGRGGFYRGSSVLITGTAGTAKTTLSAAFAAAACRRGEKCLMFVFEESPKQLVRNMRSVGLDLQPFLDQGLLYIEASRPTLNGLERHLVTVHKLIGKHKPQTVVIDPITNLISVGSLSEVRSMLTRLIDYLKVNGITALFTALTSPRNGQSEMTEEGVSSLVDTWINVRDLEGVGERNRGLSILKSRGMGHSNQVREFLVTDNGIQLLDVIIGPGGIVTGAGRLTQELQEQAQAVVRQQELIRKDRELERKRRVLEATIANLRTEFESVEEELRQINDEEATRREALHKGRQHIANLSIGRIATPPDDQP
ncbi:MULTISPECIES: circadian clock protein KaiC [Hymenobacter]|uniref:non-specific serine/threonine protein kinase n=2 Tax=Hymenobacter TaxID=89966 RepID=A0ABS6X3J9_9BACT|nr:MULTISPECIES: circadian clock protein KaiC [Hymenobacter]MBO3271276.1 circadian clock protein KaiC [Hymenobacter defluvii]MBW3130402.1 circadian clock protein KaiC [Hymenobacter profundi]QNE41358.1 circadian clock protein KaiC [Hymenobacter sp. NBH84]